MIVFRATVTLRKRLGQMFARGGLKVNAVTTLPYNVYAPAATKLEYSVFLYSIGNSTPNSGQSLRNVMMTYNKESRYRRVQSWPVLESRIRCHGQGGAHRVR